MAPKRLILLSLFLAVLILGMICVQGFAKSAKPGAEKILEKNPEKNLETQKEPGLVKDVGPVIVIANEKIEKEKSTSSPVIQSSGSVQPGPRMRRPGGNTILQINLTAGSPTRTTVLLDWTAHSDADRFVVQKNQNAGWLFVDTVPRTQNYYLVTGLMPRTTYRFRVLALNGPDLLNISNEVSVTTMAGPVNFVLNGTATINTVSLSWTHWPAPRYFVQGNSSGVWRTIMTVYNNSYIVAGLNRDTAYWFQVQAVDAQNALLGTTNVLQITTQANITISSCANLTQPMTYVLNQTVYGVQAGRTMCIDVRASNIVFDCNSAAIIGSRSPGSIGINIGAYSNVTIKRCNIENYDVGISLAGNSAVLLQNNARNNQRGFSLVLGQNNMLINNTAYNNSLNGFYIILGLNNTFINNTAQNNSYSGFLTSRSQANTFENNLVYSNAQYGFSIGANSNSNTFTGNAVFNNSLTGFYIRSSAQNVLINNTAAGSQLGFHLNSSSNNTLMRNSAINNPYAGFFIYTAAANILMENVEYNSTFGFYLYASQNLNVLMNNTARNNQYGVYLFSSVGNALIDNAVHNNSHTGFYMDSSSNNIFVDNMAHDNQNAFYLYFGSNNTFAGNAAYSNSNRGVYMWQTSSNVFNNNFVHDNNHGFGAYATSNFNTFAGNDVHDNLNDGFLIYFSPSNTIANNTVYNNTASGINVVRSPNILIYNNYLSNANNAFDDLNNSWNITQTAGPNIIGGPSIGGNYWSNYTGSDTNGDGFGDTPYAVPSGPSFDYLPLM